MNERGKQLLLKYIDVYLINIKEHLINLDALIDEKKLKESVNNYSSIHKCKTYIDNYIKEKMVKFFNEKYQLVKENPYFLINDYNLFGFDYNLCNRLLEINNYRCNVCETIYTKMNDSYDLDKCKEIVLSFYKSILKNDKDYELVKNIMNNVTFIDEEIRSFTNVKSKEVYVRRSDDYNFLITLVHELAHAYVLEKNPIDNKDVRLIEMDSMCMEVLFLKYLQDEEIDIIQEEDETRTITDYDIEDYFINNYSMFVLYARTVVDEMNITYIIGNNDKDEIDMEVFNKLIEISPYNNYYFITAKILNDFLDRYLCCDINQDTYEKGKTVIDTFTNNVSYICSGLFLNYFYNILDREEEKDKFIMYINNSNEFSFTNFINMFGLTLKDYRVLTSKMMIDFHDIMKQDEYNVSLSDMYKNIIKEELDEYNELVNRELNSDDLFTREFMEVIKIGRLLKVDEFNLDLYPFDIKYQLDDNEVDIYEESKKKLILYEIERNKRNINYDL